MTKQNRYEDKLKSEGLKKTTVWLPEEMEPELRELIEFFRRNRHCEPMLVARDMNTNKFVSVRNK